MVYDNKTIYLFRKPGRIENSRHFVCARALIALCALITDNKERQSDTVRGYHTTWWHVRSLKEGEGYKNVGLLEADVMSHKQMKEKIKKEYLRRLRKVAQLK